MRFPIQLRWGSCYSRACRRTIHGVNLVIAPSDDSVILREEAVRNDLVESVLPLYIGELHYGGGVPTHTF